MPPPHGYNITNHTKVTEKNWYFVRYSQLYSYLMRLFAICWVTIAIVVTSIAFVESDHVALSEHQDDRFEFARTNNILPWSTQSTEELDKAVHHHSILARKTTTTSTTAREELVVRTEKVFRVCFHIPWNFIGVNGRRVTNQVLQNALDHLNKAFTAESCCDPALDWCEPGNCSTNSNIRFVMATQNLIGKLTNDVTEDVSDSKACVSRRYNPLWSRISTESFLEISMKSALHKGDVTVLNIYVTKFILSVSRGGYMSQHTKFPWEYASQPKQDGVMVHPSALPGIDGSDVDILVHEVG